MEGAEALVHLAPLPDAWPPGMPEGEALDLCARGTFELLRAAVSAGVPRVVLGSTLDLFEAYPPGWAVHEGWRPRPGTELRELGPYLAELVGREIARAGWPLLVVCLRLGRLWSGDGGGADPDGALALRGGRAAGAAPGPGLPTGGRRARARAGRRAGRRTAGWCPRPPAGTSSTSPAGGGRASPSGRRGARLAATPREHDFGGHGAARRRPGPARVDAQGRLTPVGEAARTAPAPRAGAPAADRLRRLRAPRRARRPSWRRATPCASQTSSPQKTGRRASPSGGPRRRARRARARRTRSAWWTSPTPSPCRRRRREQTSCSTAPWCASRLPGPSGSTPWAPTTCCAPPWTGDPPRGAHRAPDPQPRPPAGYSVDFDVPDEAPGARRGQRLLPLQVPGPGARPAPSPRTTAWRSRRCSSPPSSTRESRAPCGAPRDRRPSPGADAGLALRRAVEVPALPSPFEVLRILGDLPQGEVLQPQGPADPGLGPARLAAAPLANRTLS